MSGQVEATAKFAPCPHCGDPHGEDQLRCPKTDMLLAFEGRRLDGKFRFLSSLGSGGMASVWLARNERVDREVAIKFLRPEIGRDPEAVARFRSEARAAGRIGNQHICEILDLGDSPIGPYIVMERLRGLDLAALIRRQGRLQPSYAVRIVRHALEGLSAAHAAGIVHRDLKPGNVFLHRTDAGDTQVKLMDFGVSKFLDGTGDAMTASGILLGTPEYMAPEQLEGANKFGPPGDIFAIGAILYRAITGELVFSGTNLAAVLRSMAVDEPTPVDKLIEGLPSELVAVIHRCLQRDPAARFASAAELSDALAPFEQFEGEVKVLEPPNRVSSASMAAAHSSLHESGSEAIENPILAPVVSAIADADIEIEAELEGEDESESDPAESVESATRQWTQDASGPLRDRDPERKPTGTNKAIPVAVASDEPEPEPEPEREREPGRRAIWPWFAIVGLGVAALAFFNREWVMDRVAALDSPTQDLAGAESDEAHESPSPDAIAETSALDVDDETTTTPIDATETGATETGATETGATETGATETGETGETGETDHAGELVTDRPAPAGTFRAGSYITPNDTGPTDDQAAAREYCEGLATKQFAGVSKWRLANPSELGNFLGTKVKKSRYWTSAIWQGKARVYWLPNGKKTSEKLDKKIARPLCVARW
jgi:serine/threonine protein kinase